MTVERRARALPLVGALAAALVAPPLAAQASADSAGHPLLVGIVGGVSQFDLSGTGTTPFGAARLVFPMSRVLVLEASVGVMRPDEQGGSRSTYALPETQLQVQIPWRALRPYLGGGAGMVFAPSRVGNGDLTLSAAAGVRFLFAAGPALLTELRVRGIGSNFSGGAAEWTLGLAWPL